ncbi:hypothetical protein BGZ68_007089 [Mortierella alpina]|nr:hypothetical protein BGZ68_007089 [Mortierella alpina]
MTVFEIQVNPERNALIRRALAKRIVRQREVEEEEASTEEDESFLGSSITIARKGSAASVSTTGSAGNKEHQRIKTDGGGPMNAKSRWKSEYLRTRSSSPSPSGSSFMSAISEILPPEMLPQILPATLLNGNSSLDRQKTDSVRSDADGALVKTLPLGASDGGAATVSVTLNGAPLSSGEAAISTDPIQAEKRAAKPEPGDTAPAAIAIEETGPDPVERDLLLKLEGLRKEKSRLFALFRNALQKKEESSKSPQPHPPSHSTSKEPESLLAAGQAQDTKSSGAADPAGSRSVSAAAATDHLSKDQEPEDGRQGGASEARVLGRLSDHSHERRPEPLSRQTSKRREYERVFDRSKLNLEIPRKPSISSASSNSTSSTPTTSFPPPKRGRSRSPSVDGGGPFNNSNRGSSGPGSFGPSFPSTSYSSSSSSHAESTSYPSKYPRADYMGSSQQQQQQQQQHHRNPSNSSSNNGLPDKPQGRYHTSSHFQQHASSSVRSLGGDSYHADEGGYSSRSKGSSSGPGLNGGSGSGSYRQNGPMNYHSQGPPPPTRIGFGDNGGNSGSNSSGRSGGGGGGGSGGNTVSRGGFYGHGHDGPPTAPISMLGPSGRTHMPFNRSMMQMPHNRGLAHGRIGFGNGGSGGGVGGGRNGGGPPDRSMSSARPGDWSRRRSRA